MTAEELSIAISQANSWTSTSWSMIPGVVRLALARLDEREGAAEAQLTLHAALQDEPRTCSSCRKEKPAADYGNAYRTCAACSGSKRKAHALQHAHLTWAPAAGDTAVVVEASAWAPAVVDAAVVVGTRVKCTSCRQFHDGVVFKRIKTCSRCLMSRKDKTLQRRIIRDAATLEKRSDKKPGVVFRISTRAHQSAAPTRRGPALPLLPGAQ